MSKHTGRAVALLLLLNAGAATQQHFEKYRKIEAYEVRPGILMLPSYTVDNQVCEIGLEKLHYAPELIRLDSSLSRHEIEEILDELVPPDQRGLPSKEIGGALITQAGNSLTTTTDFENVSIQLYGATSSLDRKGQITVDEVVATVKWKKRVCR